MYKLKKTLCTILITIVTIFSAAPAFATFTYRTGYLRSPYQAVIPENVVKFEYTISPEEISTTSFGCDPAVAVYARFAVADAEVTRFGAKHPVSYNAFASTNPEVRFYDYMYLPDSEYYSVTVETRNVQEELCNTFAVEYIDEDVEIFRTRSSEFGWISMVDGTTILDDTYKNYFNFETQKELIFIAIVIFILLLILLVLLVL